MTHVRRCGEKAAAQMAGVLHAQFTRENKVMQAGMHAALLLQNTMLCARDGGCIPHVP